MKNYFLGMISVIICFNANLKAQSLHLDGITSSNSSFGYYDETGIIVAETSAVDLTVGSGSYELTANRIIELKRGFVADLSGGATGHFKAEIGNQELDATILEPADINHVPLYSKVEFGVSISDLETRINHFLNDNTGNYKPGTDRYNDSLASGYLLNPYDPVHISIDAVFSRPSHPNSDFIIRYGFFYNQFERDTIHETWTESEAGIDPYEWRIRFSPDETGTWRGFINVYVNEIKLSENYFFVFTVEDSDIPGFLSIDDNNRYLKFSNGDQFFAVGDNFLGFGKCYPFDDCDNVNCENNYDQRLDFGAHENNLKYFSRMTNASNGGGGGNFSRMILDPKSYEIEWERLGNYHTRQIEMYEFDEYLKLAEQREVYLMIASNAGLSLKNDTAKSEFLPVYSSLWEWNPYNKNSLNLAFSDPNRQHKGIDSVFMPIDFFTNSDAKKFYKNKLRYIDSRWGYSPNFAIHQFFNEVNAGVDTLYWEDPTIHPIVEDWHEEMADYLKNDINIKALVTGSFASTSDSIMGLPYNITGLLDLWNDPNIDIIDGHSYFVRTDGMKINFTTAKTTGTTYNKPYIHGEHATSAYWVFNPCTPRSMHQLLWSSAFSGSFGPGLDWDWTQYTYDDYYNDIGEGHVQDYVILREFFENVDLINHTYIPYTFLDINGVATAFENFYLLRSDDFKKIYGWFCNRSFVSFSYGDTCIHIDNAPGAYNESNGDCHAQPYVNIQDFLQDTTNTNSLAYGENDSYSNSQDMSLHPYYFEMFNKYTEYPKITSKFRLDSLLASTSYTIEYFYTSGPNAGTFDTTYNYTFTTNSAGQYFIDNGPPTGGIYPSDWAYIVHRSNEPRSNVIDHEVFSPIDSNRSKPDLILNQDISAIHLDQNNIYVENRSHGVDDRSAIDYNVSIVPNPNDGNFVVSFNSGTDKRYNLILSDVSGNLITIKTFDCYAGLNRINFSYPELANGVYFLKIEGINELFKIIIVN